MGYFTLAIKTITINADQFSNTIKHKIARVSELDEEHRTYTLPAYLIAQLSKSDCLDANKSITGSQLLNAAIDTVKYIQSMVGGMVVFLDEYGHITPREAQLLCGKSPATIRRYLHRLVQTGYVCAEGNTNSTIYRKRQ